MQMITDKQKIDSGRGPENTAVKKKLNSPVDISKSDEFILLHTSFFRNFWKETIFSACAGIRNGTGKVNKIYICIKIKFIYLLIPNLQFSKGLSTAFNIFADAYAGIEIEKSIFNIH